MNISKNNYLAFTLIEIIISLSILSIIMVSVLFVFINSTTLSAKTEINRVMQENIKNVVETISEDVRNNWIFWVSIEIWDDCNVENWTNNFKKWSKLCTKTIINNNETIGNKYFLSKEGSARVDPTKCENIEDNCYIAKNTVRLTNSSVAIKDLQFIVTNSWVPKVTMIIVMQPASKKWVKNSMIEDNEIVIQTTLSERIFLKK